MEFDDEIREFLIESNENLANLDREVVQLEQTPGDMALISSVFRTIHTIKGTCGFFGYEVLGSVTHIVENILSQVRERERNLTPALISLILESVDMVKVLLARIETTGAEGVDDTGPLRARLERAHQECVAQEVEGRLEEHLDLRADAADTPHAEPTPIQPSASAQHPVLEPAPPVVAPASPAADSLVPVEFAEASPEVRPEVSSEVSPEVSLEGSKEAALAGSTIRVDVGLLDRLMNLVGELVLARNQLLQDTTALNPALQQTAQRLNLITSELQIGVMKTRMQPIGVVWNKLPRVVRDLASKCGKRIKIEMDGAGTELDKTIIEAIKDPLTHLVRNSCDHGIEGPEVRRTKHKNPEGTLLLRAYHEGGAVIIEISDDGAGIDAEKVKAKAVERGLLRPEQAALMSARDAIHLIFLPGFSTAAAVTSISGRGVGMDVVKTNIEKIGGSVEVANRDTGGTTVRIKIPLTLAIIPGLVVTLDGEKREEEVGREERFIIPQANLLELVRLEGAEETKRIENVHGTPVFHHRGQLLPLVYLSQVLGRKGPMDSGGMVTIIVLQAENRQLGLVVDRIFDTQEIVVKPLGRQLKGLSSYVGATIMGDGLPALILDVSGLARLAGLGTAIRAAQKDAALTAEAGDALQPQMMLLFRAGRFHRLAVPLALVDRLEEVAVPRIEQAGGRPVLYYREDILPLIALGPILDPSHSGDPLGDLSGNPGAVIQVVVFSDGARRMGLVVDEVLDIVTDAISVVRSSPAPGLLGSALIGGKVTDLIDLKSLLAFAGEDWPTLDEAALTGARP